MHPCRNPLPDSQKRSLLVPLCGANYVKPKPQRTDTPMTPVKENAKPVAGTPVLLESRPITNGTPTPTMNGSNPHAVNCQPASPSVEGTALAQALHLTRDSLAALQRMQDQTAQLHRQFLDGQDAAQRTVQFLVEQQQRLLQASLGLPVGPAPLPPQPPIMPPVPTPRSRLGRVFEAHHAFAGGPRRLGPTYGRSHADRDVDRRRSAFHAEHGNASIETVLLEVIAEKTGYPTEMLELDMALDADLGIDSIKRVEILSALQERLPEAPVIKPEHLGTLHNLRHIAAFLAGNETRVRHAPRRNARRRGSASRTWRESDPQPCCWR